MKKEEAIEHVDVHASSFNGAANLSKFQAILAQFPKQKIGSFLESTAISIGLIHQTYQIKTTTGLFCLQRLHPKLATNEILADYEAVLRHLNQHNFPAPTLCQTTTGNNAWVDEESHYWRLTTWIEGHAYNQIKTPQMAFSAAAMLGRFHQVMESIPYEFQSTHPLHDTAHHLQCLRNAVNTHQNTPWFHKIAPLVANTEQQLPQLMLPETIPQHVVHGDPKISNILFDKEEKAIGIIDLDTCTRHSVLVDLGDAIRSWCQMGAEDEQVSFSVERFQAIVEGYATTAPPLQPQEITLLPRAGRHITLELTARFLTDVLEDNYFAWDTTRYQSRREHNLVRSEKMYELAQQMKQKETLLMTIVNQTFNA